MCGIIGLYGDGVSGSWSGPKRDFMIEGLIADSVRGYDSTGIALLPKTKDDDLLVYKRAFAGYDFVQQKHANRLFDNIKNSLGMIGHNRSATKGVVNDRNSHPFRWKHITLVHNGTVYNADSLVDKKDKPSGVSVDSEYVAHALSMEDADDILPRLRGGYSLVWFNEEERSLNFARNDQKPMFLAFGSNDQTVYFGSEAELIVWLCSRRNISIQEDIYRLVPNVHYIIKDPSNVKEISKVPFVQGQFSKLPVPTGHTPRREPWTPTTQEQQQPLSGTTQDTPDQNGTNNGSLLQRTGDEKSSDNGKEVTYTRENLSPGDASGIRKEAKGKRLEEMHALLAKHGLTSSVILATGIQWFAYNTQPNEQVAQHGWMMAQSINSAAKGALLQIFHVTKKEWNDKYKDSLLYLEPVNFRKGRDPDQVVCRIREDLQKKHRKDATDSGSKEATDGTKESTFGLMDSGTKDGWVEIGSSRKRLVHPLAYVSMVRGGCYHCGNVLPDNLGDIMWIGMNDDKPVCKSCYENPQVLETLQYVH